MTASIVGGTGQVWLLSPEAVGSGVLWGVCIIAVVFFFGTFTMRG